MQISTLFHGILEANKLYNKKPRSVPLPTPHEASNFSLMGHLNQ